MPAGALRERVSLQWRDPDAQANEYNETPDEWANLLEDLPAEVYALSGREFVAAQQVQAAATHRVLIRTPSSIAVRQQYRFVWIEILLAGTEVTHYLDINQVTPLVTRRGYTECLCTEHLGG